MKVMVETSAHHVHVSDADLEALFGTGATLTNKKDLSQPGQFACEEKVEVVGPKGSMKMSILGPTRPETQVEISLTDARKLGVTAPIRESGDLEGTLILQTGQGPGQGRTGRIQISGQFTSVHTQEDCVGAGAVFQKISGKSLFQFSAGQKIQTFLFLMIIQGKDVEHVEDGLTVMLTVFLTGAEEETPVCREDPAGTFCPDGVAKRVFVKENIGFAEQTAGRAVFDVHGFSHIIILFQDNGAFQNQVQYGRFVIRENNRLSLWKRQSLSMGAVKNPLDFSII